MSFNLSRLLINLKHLKHLRDFNKRLKNLWNFKIKHLKRLKNLNILKHLKHLKPFANLKIASLDRLNNLKHNPVNVKRENTNILKHLKIQSMGNLSLKNLKHLNLKNLKHLNVRNLNNLKHLNIRNLKNLKRPTLLLLLNLVIVFAIYFIFNHKFSTIDTPALTQKINQEKASIDNLKHKLSHVSKHKQTANGFALGKQARLLKMTTSVFADLKTTVFKANNKGLVYLMSGNSKDVLLLAHKLNKAIGNNRIKAQLKSVLINKGGAVLKVQVFGTNLND